MLSTMRANSPGLSGGPGDGAARVEQACPPSRRSPVNATRPDCALPERPYEVVGTVRAPCGSCARHGHAIGAASSRLSSASAPRTHACGLTTAPSCPAPGARAASSNSARADPAEPRDEHGEERHGHLADAALWFHRGTPWRAGFRRDRSPARCGRGGPGGVRRAVSPCRGAPQSPTARRRPPRSTARVLFRQSPVHSTMGRATRRATVSAGAPAGLGPRERGHGHEPGEQQRDLERPHGHRAEHRRRAEDDRQRERQDEQQRVRGVRGQVERASHLRRAPGSGAAKRVGRILRAVWIEPFAQRCCERNRALPEGSSAGTTSASSQTKCQPASCAR